jgi:hypothetical protein
MAGNRLCHAREISLQPLVTAAAPCYNLPQCKAQDMSKGLLAAISWLALSASLHATEVTMCSGTYDVARGGDTVSNKNSTCVINWDTQAFRQIQDFCGANPGGICTFRGRVSRRAGRFYFIDKIVGGL